MSGLRSTWPSLPSKIMLAMATLGTLIALVAWVLNQTPIARGALAGTLLGVAYLAILWRTVRAFLARAQGVVVTPLDRVALGGGMFGRLLLVGLFLAVIARHHPHIDLWAAILTFFLYRILLGVNQAIMAIGAKWEPIPSKPGPQKASRVRFRENHTIGRRRSRD